MLFFHHQKNKERRIIRHFPIKKITALLCALALTACLGVPALAGSEEAAPRPGAFAQADETHWEGGSLTITDVEIAEEYVGYVDSTRFDNTTRIVYDGGAIDVDNEKYTAILTVDGVQHDLFNAAGQSFTGDVVITLIEKDASFNTGNAKFGDDAGSLIAPFYYAAAAYYNEDGYRPESSVPAAWNGAAVDDGSVTGMNYVSNGDYFAGVYANAGDITITDSSFTAVGRGGDDFTGQGISVAASGEANVTIQGCVFRSQGALRSAIFSGGSAHVDVIDTVVQTLNDEDLVAYNTEDNYATQMMQQTPFALGLTGNVRATLVLGQAELSFTNCLVASNGWVGGPGATTFVVPYGTYEEYLTAPADSEGAVTLRLTGSTWTCTGLSYLSSLALDADSVINGDVYQYGERVIPKAGTVYEDVVVPAGADYAAAVAAGTAAIEADAAAGVVPADRSELVANTDLGMGGMASGEASGEAS